MKRRGFGDVLGICNLFSRVKALLPTTGVRIVSYIFVLPYGTLLGRFNGAHVKFIDF
jgi:hypothetical protein